MKKTKGNFNTLKDNGKILIVGLIGSAIEWFDYFMYGTAAALVFNKNFSKGGSGNRDHAVKSIFFFDFLYTTVSWDIFS